MSKKFLISQILWVLGNKSLGSNKDPESPKKSNSKKSNASKSSGALADDEVAPDAENVAENEDEIVDVDNENENEEDQNPAVKNAYLHLKIQQDFDPEYHKTSQGKFGKHLESNYVDIGIVVLVVVFLACVIAEIIDKSGATNNKSSTNDAIDALGWTSIAILIGFTIEVFRNYNYRNFFD